METDINKLPPPPGLIPSLARGFDSVANHILVILPPVLLDLFLWLGPHLRLTTFLQLMQEDLTALAKTLPSNGMPDLTTIQQSQMDVLNQFNLFTVLRTFPVGVTSLFSSQVPTQNPLGSPWNWDAGSFLGVIGWILVLVFLGWLVGALYYFWISIVALAPQERLFWKSIQQTMLLSAFWLAVLFILGFPVMFFISVISLISPFLGQIVLFGAALLLIWLVVPIFFSVHGIFALQQNAFRSAQGSLRMARFTLPNTSLFLFSAALINAALGFLWNIPSQSSWWMLVGIIGHAFVSTAFLAASFIYYRDINVWLTTVFDQLQKQASSASVN